VAFNEPEAVLHLETAITWSETSNSQDCPSSRSAGVLTFRLRFSPNQDGSTVPIPGCYGAI